MKIRSILSGVAITALVGACGGDDGPSYDDPATTNPASATSAVTAVSGVNDAFASGNGTAAMGAIVQLSSAAQLMVQPDYSQSALGRSPFPTQHELESMITHREATGTCECTADSCHFVDCSESGITINGDISKSGDTYTWDLSITIEGDATLSLDWNMSGEITVTPTLIDGRLSTDGHGTIDYEGTHGEYDYDIDVAYNAIGLSDCGPSSGSIEALVAYSVDVSGPNGSASEDFSGRGTVSFGAGCVATAE
jgi:hypothetical protein